MGMMSNLCWTGLTVVVKMALSCFGDHISFCKNKCFATSNISMQISSNFAELHQRPNLYSFQTLPHTFPQSCSCVDQKHQTYWYFATVFPFRSVHLWWTHSCIYIHIHMDFFLLIFCTMQLQTFIFSYFISYRAEAGRQRKISWCPHYPAVLMPDCMPQASRKPLATNTTLRTRLRPIRHLAWLGLLWEIKSLDGISLCLRANMRFNMFPGSLVPDLCLCMWNCPPENLDQ